MLRDITIGQHFPGTSLVHRFDPRMKLVLTIVHIVLLFAASNPLGLDRKSTRLNSSHNNQSRMPSSA